MTIHLAEFTPIDFIPNDPPRTGYDKMFGQSGLAWRHKCGREGSMTSLAVLRGWKPYCTSCGIGPRDESEE